MRSRYPILFFIAVIFSLVFCSFGIARASGPTSPPDPPEKKVRDGTHEKPDIDPYREAFDRKLNDPLMTLAPSDSYGYTWNDTVIKEFQHIDSSGEAVFVDLDNPDRVFDDEYSEAISLGFEFKFYEETHTEIIINVNGFVTFSDSSSGSFSNTFIPIDTPPNNFIAPMWDDLAMGGTLNSGQVYYESKGSSPNREFIIEWYEVSRLGSGTDLLTFEIILKESGDILFRYDTLNGVLDEASVGIEDPDGSDGLRYLYNEPMPDPVKDVLFTRPPDTPRVKALPAYQSGFAYAGKIDFQVVLSNIGEPNNDIINLVVSGDPSWDISFFSEDGISPLTDHDSDGFPDTGLLAPGGAKKILVRCQAPGSAEAGDFNQVYLTAISSLDDTKNKTVLMQAAISTSFAKAFADSLLGLNLNLISEGKEIISKAEDWYSGSTLALADLPNGKYIYIWERNNSIDFKPYTDIEYTILNRYGTQLKLPTKLTDNQTEPLSTNDHVPVAAALQNGTAGVVWVRDIENNSNPADITKKSNVILALLGTDGNLQDPPGLINITGNSVWRGEGDLNIPLFASPRITSISDTRFLIVWTDQRLMSTGDTSSIWYAVYDTSINDLVKNPTPLTSNDLDVKRYFDSNVAGLQGDKALVTYTIFNHNDSSYTIAYLVLDIDGNQIKSETVIPEKPGWGPDVTQLSTGKIMLVWTNPENNTIAYKLIDKTSFAVTNNDDPIELANPNLRLPDYVSVTYDQEGHGILTWMDSNWNDYLYYALVDSSGIVVTPPMIFSKGHAADPLILSSYSGYGNAPYEYADQIFLPMIKR